MELIRKKYYYPGLTNPSLSAETFNFPIFLSQDLFNTGIFTDANNVVAEVITGFTAVWDLSYDGSLQKDCKTTNGCQITSTVSDVTIYNGNNGSIAITITNLNQTECPGPVEISWVGPDGYTNNTTNITNITSGNYTLKIIDAECNRTFRSYYISQPPALDATLVVDNSQVNATNNFCNGSATVVATGGVPPYTYAWYSAGTTSPVLSTSPSITNLCLGSSYYVVVTDADGTEITQFFELTLPEPLSGKTISVINIDCQGTPGSVEVEGLGGIVGTGYTYQLLSGSPAVPINQNNTGLFENIGNVNSAYIVRIIDSVGQTFDLYVSVTQPIQPITEVTFTVSNSFNDGFDTEDATYPPNGELFFSIFGGIGITPPGGSCCVYNVSTEAIFGSQTGGPGGPYFSGLENSSINDGNYALVNSTNFYQLQSGWYRFVAEDTECLYEKEFYVGHQYDPEIGVVSLGGGILRATAVNSGVYEPRIMLWEEGSNTALCPGSCTTNFVDSFSFPSGSEITLIVGFINNVYPTDPSENRVFKRKFKMP